MQLTLLQRIMIIPLLLSVICIEVNLQEYKIDRMKKSRMIDRTLKNRESPRNHEQKDENERINSLTTQTRDVKLNEECGKEAFNDRPIRAAYAKEVILDSQQKDNNVLAQRYAKEALKSLKMQETMKKLTNIKIPLENVKQSVQFPSKEQSRNVARSEVNTRHLYKPAKIKGRRKRKRKRHKLRHKRRKNQHPRWSKRDFSKIDYEPDKETRDLASYEESQKSKSFGDNTRQRRKETQSINNSNVIKVIKTNAIDDNSDYLDLTQSSISKALSNFTKVGSSDTRYNGNESMVERLMRTTTKDTTKKNAGDQGIEYSEYYNDDDVFNDVVETKVQLKPEEPMKESRVRSVRQSWNATSIYNNDPMYLQQGGQLAFEDANMYEKNPRYVDSSYKSMNGNQAYPSMYQSGFDSNRGSVAQDVSFSNYLPNSINLQLEPNQTFGPGQVENSIDYAYNPVISQSGQDGNFQFVGTDVSNSLNSQSMENPNTRYSKINEGKSFDYIPYSPILQSEQNENIELENIQNSLNYPAKNPAIFQSELDQGNRFVGLNDPNLLNYAANPMIPQTGQEQNYQSTVIDQLNPSDYVPIYGSIIEGNSNPGISYPSFNSVQENSMVDQFQGSDIDQNLLPNLNGENMNIVHKNEQNEHRPLVHDISQFSDKFVMPQIYTNENIKPESEEANDFFPQSHQKIYPTTQSSLNYMPLSYKSDNLGDSQMSTNLSNVVKNPEINFDENVSDLKNSNKIPLKKISISPSSRTNIRPVERFLNPDQLKRQSKELWNNYRGPNNLQLLNLQEDANVDGSGKKQSARSFGRYRSAQEEQSQQRFVQPKDNIMRYGYLPQSALMDEDIGNAQRVNITATVNETKEVADQILNRIIDELEEMKDHSKNKQKEGLPCKLSGSWITSAAGVRIDMKVTNHSITATLANLTVEPAHQGLLNTTWNITGFAPFRRGGPFSLVANDNRTKSLAVFVGSCRVCQGIDTIEGVWSISREPKDCRHFQMAVGTFNDIFRRTRILAYLKDKRGSLMQNHTTNVLNSTLTVNATLTESTTLKAKEITAKDN